MDRKTIKTTVRLKAVATNAGGEISGYANVFDVVDRMGEIVTRGAFAESIKAFDAGELKIPLVDSHLIGSGTEAVIGKVTELKEDSTGLLFKAILSNTSGGQDVRTKIREGILDSLSIGYQIKKDDRRSDGVRMLRKLALIEISVVAFPANVNASISTVKRMERTRANVKKALVQQTLKELEYLEARAEEVEELERRVRLMEQLAGPAITEAAKKLTPEECGWII